MEDGYAPDLMEQETTKPIPTLVRVVNILNQKVKNENKKEDKVMKIFCCKNQYLYGGDKDKFKNKFE